MTVRGSRLVQMVQEARRTSSWWLAWIVGILVLRWVAPIGVRLGNTVLDDPASTSALYPYVDAFAALAMLAALWVWVKFKDGRPFATVGFRPSRDWVRLLVGFALGGGLVSVGVVVGLIVGVYQDGRSTHLHTGFAAILPIVPLIVLFALQGIAYEAVTRGYMLQVGVSQVPVWVAVASTAILAGTLQTLNPVMLLNAILYAVLASLIALQQGSVWLVAGLLAGWNCFQLNVFGLPVGGIPDATAMWSIGPVAGSSSILSGGPFGPAAGLLTTLVLVPATVVAYLRLRRTARVGRDARPSLDQSAPVPPAEPLGEPTTAFSRKEHSHVPSGH